jgi:hypothetical protein
MKRILILAAVGEAATGVALLIVPSLVGRLLFDWGKASGLKLGAPDALL